MKIRTALFVIIGLCLLSAAVISAETKFSYDGQIRLRSELDLKSFANERHGKNFNDLRTRLGFKFEPTDLAKIYIQFQDSRQLGNPSSGDLNSTDNVDLHQAYFDIKHVGHEYISVKGGRFEVNYGNQRVFGAVGWHNIGRSWEGLVASVTPENFQLDLFYLKKMEINSGGYNRDFDIIGLYGMFKNAHLDVFTFYELDADSNGYSQAKLKRYNFGAYYNNTFDLIDVTLQANYQLGEMPEGQLPDTMIVDIAAFMVNGEFGYSFEGKGKARLALGLDYTSGDDGTDSTKYKAYTNAYYTGHAFRGYMDYFLGSPATGLIDGIFRAQASPAPNWMLKGDFHYFKAAENYYGPVSESLTSNIGYEFDLTVVNKSMSGAVLTGGFSMFIPDEDYAGITDKKTGLWGYIMTTVAF